MIPISMVKIQELPGAMPPPNYLLIRPCVDYKLKHVLYIEILHNMRHIIYAILHLLVAANFKSDCHIDIFTKYDAYFPTLLVFVFTVDSSATTDENEDQICSFTVTVRDRDYLIRAPGDLSVAEALVKDKKCTPWADIPTVNSILHAKHDNKKCKGEINLGVPIYMVNKEKFTLERTKENENIAHRFFLAKQKICFFYVDVLKWKGGITVLKKEYFTSICVPYTHDDSFLESLYKDGRFNKERLGMVKVIDADEKAVIPNLTSRIGPEKHGSHLEIHWHHKFPKSTTNFKDLSVKWDDDLKRDKRHLIRKVENREGASNKQNVEIVINHLTLIADSDNKYNADRLPKEEVQTRSDKSDMEDEDIIQLKKSFFSQLYEKFKFKNKTLNSENHIKAIRNLLKDDNFHNGLSKQLRVAMLDHLAKIQPLVCSVMKADSVEHNGTGFYIGEGKILTCYHVLTLMNNKRDIPFPQGFDLFTHLKATACFGVNYNTEPHQRSKLGKIIACDKSLDYAIVELESPFKHQPDIPILENPPDIPEYSQVHIVGFPFRSQEKMVDYGCTVLTEPTVIFFCTKVPEKPFDHQLSYHSSFFHGASGSPVVDGNGQIIAMHRKGFYEFPQKVVPGSPSVYEAGVMLEAVFKHAKEAIQNSSTMF